MNQCRHGLLLLTCLMVSACSNQPLTMLDGAPLARQVIESDQCGVGSAGLTYLSSAEDLQTIENWPARNLSMTLLKRIDFEREHLLVVGLGEKPTGGYALTLANSMIENDVLNLTVYLRRPPADAMVTQVVTTPCAILAITPEKWRRIEVHSNGLETQTLDRR